MPGQDPVSVTLTQTEWLTLITGLHAFVGLLTGQLEDSGHALVGLADEAGVMLLANSTIALMEQVGTPAEASDGAA